ncbi:MAG: type II toxin-antitoxin system RelE/ParE family toxin [Hyphomicrobiaceae bacterium]
MTTVLFRPAAQRDLEAITAYIAADNPDRADTFRQELIDLCRSLDQQPRRGSPRDDLGKDLRMLAHGNYLVFYDYHEEPDQVHILRVTHGSRQLTNLKIR